MELQVGFLELENGKCPYLDWEEKLDKFTRGAVRVKINRLRLGNLGDCKTIRGARGLYELRIHLGAGYRLYFGKAAVVQSDRKNAILKEPKNTGNFIRSCIGGNKLW